MRGSRLSSGCPWELFLEQRSIAEIDRRILPAKSRTRSAKQHFRFDVAISFAGSERPVAEQLAKVVQDAGFEVFYDAFYPEEALGQGPCGLL